MKRAAARAFILFGNTTDKIFNTGLTILARLRVKEPVEGRSNHNILDLLFSKLNDLNVEDDYMRRAVTG